MTEAPSFDKETVLFTQLIISLHQAALMQLGKFAHPETGVAERDLDSARMTIDTLQMLRSKTQGNLSREEESLFDQILAELKLNYVDEAGKPASKSTLFDASTAPAGETASSAP